MNVSNLGFGGAEIGFEGTPPEVVENLLNAALDAGLNVIDTAECYADSEEKIGKAVGHRRDEFYLFSKCGHAGGFDLPDWDPKMLAMSIDRSLARLQTDRLDLVQLHSCEEAMLRQGDVIDVLRRAREAGKARAIGYSGDREAALFAVECGAFDSLQTSCNVADQQCIELTLPKAHAAGMGVIAKRPVANVAWRNGDQPPENEYARPYWERLQKLQYDFLKLPTHDAVSVALRFTLAQPGVSVAIVGTKSPERWAENARQLQAGPLASDDVRAIRARWHEVEEPDWEGMG